MVYCFLIFGLLAFDLLTKALADAFSVHVALIPRFLELNITFNRGAAFSWLSDKSWSQAFFIGLSAVICIAFVIALVKLPKTKRVAKLSFSFLLAGALGNMVDRIAFNYVRDFVDFPWFANCNFADFFITAGCILLFVHILFLDEDALFRKKKEDA